MKFTRFCVTRAGPEASVVPLDLAKKGFTAGQWQLADLTREGASRVLTGTAGAAGAAAAAAPGGRPVVAAQGCVTLMHLA